MKKWDIKIIRYTIYLSSSEAVYFCHFLFLQISGFPIAFTINYVSHHYQRATRIVSSDKTNHCYVRNYSYSFLKIIFFCKLKFPVNESSLITSNNKLMEINHWKATNTVWH